MKIPFTRTTVVGTEIKYLSEAIISNTRLTEDGKFSGLCKTLISQITESSEVVLTGSCTQALEMIAILLNLKAGDEIIMPSYTFVSAANAFVLHGGLPVFVDVNPSTMNIDAELIESAITSRTKAIMIMHYGGVSCEMDAVTSIAKRFNLPLIEDAAQALSSSYNNKPLGSFGDFSVFSFHNTKNYSCGEGGALIINNDKFVSRANIIRDKGTNRKQFLAGMAEKYEWTDVGASYVLSELNAAFLFAHLEAISLINKYRMTSWLQYKSELEDLAMLGLIETQKISPSCKHNAHIFYIKLKDSFERQKMISYLKYRDIIAAFHYIPLHSTVPGKLHGRLSGDDIYSTKESNRLLRLPLYHGITQEEVSCVTKTINEFFAKEV